MPCSCSHARFSPAAKSTYASAQRRGHSSSGRSKPAVPSQSCQASSRESWIPMRRCSGLSTKNSPPNDQNAWPPSEASGSWSSSSTLRPASHSSAVATSPARPAPTTITSALLWLLIGCDKVSPTSCVKARDELQANGKLIEIAFGHGRDHHLHPGLDQRLVVDRSRDAEHVAQQARGEQRPEPERGDRARLLLRHRALGALPDPRGKARERRAYELLDGGLQQLRPVARVGGEDAQQLGLAVKLGEDVARGQRQFRFDVSQGPEHVADLSQRAEPGELALDAGGQHRFLAWEVVIDAAGARCEPRRGLDLGDAGGGVSMLAEQVHRFVDDALAGRGRA